mmetsp:Transcript_16979/g.25470  ORF Transcript_16979/g.25470 Transcript_16979/m.25470 type:complete len:81 (+) Transcript_16979:666-908(+)
MSYGTGKALVKVLSRCKVSLRSVHRNLYEVFLSGAHMASMTYGWMLLQSPNDENLQEYIFGNKERFFMMNTLNAGITQNY